jgi:hypothetical protein
MRILKSWLLLVLLTGIAAPVLAQTGGPVVVKAIDTSTGATTDVGDNTNHAVRVNIIAGAGSGGTAAADNAAFTQGTTSETPAAGLYITSYANATTGHNTVWQMTIDGMGYVNVGKINGIVPLMGNGTTGTGSQRVTIASDNTAFSVNAVQSGTWTVQPGNTPNTSQWLVKSGPFDACGTTTYDPAPLLIADTTLDVLTATTTCAETFVVANVGSTQETITIQDTQGTPVQLVKVVPIAPGASLVLNGLGGLKFASGIKYQASTANKLSIWAKGRQ